MDRSQRESGVQDVSIRNDPQKTNFRVADNYRPTGSYPAKPLKARRLSDISAATGD